MEERKWERNDQNATLHFMSASRISPLVEKTQSTHVLELIKQRRSIGKVTQESPTRAQIEQLLEAATYAPNHHVAEPWHFFVVMGEARERLGEAMANGFRARMQDVDHDADDESEEVRMRLWQERHKPLRAPVIITVATRAALRKQEPLIEDPERLPTPFAAKTTWLS